MINIDERIFQRRKPLIGNEQTADIVQNLGNAGIRFFGGTPDKESQADDIATKLALMRYRQDLINASREPKQPKVYKGYAPGSVIPETEGGLPLSNVTVGEGGYRVPTYATPKPIPLPKPPVRTVSRRPATVSDIKSAGDILERSKEDWLDLGMATKESFDPKKFINSINSLNPIDWVNWKTLFNPKKWEEPIILNPEAMNMIRLAKERISDPFYETTTVRNLPEEADTNEQPQFNTPEEADASGLPAGMIVSVGGRPYEIG